MKLGKDTILVAPVATVTVFFFFLSGGIDQRGKNTDASEYFFICF